MLITDAAPAALSGDPWEAVAELKTLALLIADVASAVNSQQPVNSRVVVDAEGGLWYDSWRNESGR